MSAGTDPAVAPVPGCTGWWPLRQPLAVTRMARQSGTTPTAYRRSHRTGAVSVPDWEDHPAHGQPAYETVTRSVTGRSRISTALTSVSVPLPTAPSAGSSPARDAPSRPVCRVTRRQTAQRCT